ncbi:MAG: hypothetical protein FJ290_24515 [Planctomycetes bacterium]|nr:hypothetical protein [Planctomycetota bacterium]
MATAQSPEVLRGPPIMTLLAGVRVAKATPTLDFLYYPCQTYRGNPWSCWGGGLAANGQYYSSIGDHNGAGGACFLYAYDPASKQLRELADVRKALGLPKGSYSPGMIAAPLARGSDGWLYAATCRVAAGSGRQPFDGDWVFRCDPQSGKAEAVGQPVAKHSLPCTVLDPKRLILYGGAVPADGRGDAAKFFAYGLKAKRLLFSCDGGPTGALIFTPSTGRVYFVPGAQGPLSCYDPDTGKVTKLGVEIGLRAATRELPDGCVYTVAPEGDAVLWRVNPKANLVEGIGSAVIGSQNYVAALDADPAGRYLYYVPGANGGAERDGAPIVQFDVQKKSHKVIAFLYPFLKEKCGYIPVGTFSLAVDPRGDKVYVTWNGSFGAMKGRELVWDACALSVIHIPESERQP